MYRLCRKHSRFVIVTVNCGLMTDWIKMGETSTAGSAVLLLVGKEIRSRYALFTIFIWIIRELNSPLLKACVLPPEL